MEELCLRLNVRISAKSFIVISLITMQTLHGIVLLSFDSHSYRADGDL